MITNYVLCEHLNEFVFKDSCTLGFMYCKKCQYEVPAAHIVELLIRRLKDESDA